jgi:hypothetical protein
MDDEDKVAGNEEDLQTVTIHGLHSYNEIFLVRMKGQWWSVAKATPTMFLTQADAEEELQNLQKTVGNYYEVVRAIVALPKKPVSQPPHDEDAVKADEKRNEHHLAAIKRASHVSESAMTEAVQEAEADGISKEKLFTYLKLLWEDVDVSRQKVLDIFRVKVPVMPVDWLPNAEDWAKLAKVLPKESLSFYMTHVKPGNLEYFSLLQLWGSRSPEETDVQDVHTGHCCVHHGCKYRNLACSVVTGLKVQNWLCESCLYELGRT